MVRHIFVWGDMVIYVFKRKNIILTFIMTAVIIAAGISVYAVTPKAEDREVIVIDAGHGGADGGCSASDGTRESDINLQTASALKDRFEKAGYRVVMTREDDSSLSEGKFVKRKDLEARRNTRDKSGAIMFISIHSNTFSDSKYHGAQVVYKSGDADSEKLAIAVQSKIREKIDEENKRVPMASSDIYVLNEGKCPCILVECGFLSNKEELEKLKSKEYRDKIADAVFSGCSEYIAGNQNNMLTIDLKR